MRTETTMPIDETRADCDRAMASWKATLQENGRVIGAMTAAAGRLAVEMWRTLGRDPTELWNMPQPVDPPEEMR